MKRRGVSEVTGSVIMLGIVGSIAALILAFGLNAIVDFQTFLIDVDQTESTLKERLVINNVDFQANGDILIYVRNVGKNIVTIESFMITNIDTQINILFKNEGTDILVVQPKTLGKQTFVEGDGTPDPDSPNPDHLCISFPSVNTSCLITANYDIRIVTDRGNIFVAEVRPFRV